MSKLERLKRKYGENIKEYNLTIREDIIEREIEKNKQNGIEKPKVVAFPFIIFWKRRLRNKKWVRGIFKIFEVRYNIEKKKFTVVSIIQAPGIYRNFHNAYFFGKLDASIQVFDIYLNKDIDNFVCRFGIQNEEKLLKNPHTNYKQYIFGSLYETEEKPWIELHLRFDKGNIFHNQGFYFCDWSAKKALKSLGIGFLGGLVHYFAFGLIYEGVINALTSIKPIVKTAGIIIHSIKNEFDK